MSLDEEKIATCSEHSQHKIVVAQEQGRQFRLNNDARTWISKITIDGCYFTGTTTCCDYLFELGQPISYALYVELKGSNVSKAYAQLVATITHFQARHANLPRKCYIIATRVPKETPTVSNLKRRLAKQNIRVEVQTNRHTIKTSAYVGYTSKAQ